MTRKGKRGKPIRLGKASRPLPIPAGEWWGLASDSFRDGLQPRRSRQHRHYRSAFGGVEPPESPAEEAMEA